MYTDFKKIFRKTVFLWGTIVVLGLILFAAAYFRQDIINAWVRVKTALGPSTLIVGAYLVLPMVGFPIVPLLILLGSEFGALMGALIMAAVMPLHLVVAYFATQTLLYGFIRRLAGKKTPKLLKNLEGKNLIKFGCIFMIIPGLSYSLKNYLLPLTGISFGGYLACAWFFQGIMGFLFVVAGQAVSDWHFPVLIAIIAIIVTAALLRSPALTWTQKFMKTDFSSSKTPHSSSKEDLL